jgi:hypothetical protein
VGVLGQSACGVAMSRLGKLLGRGLDIADSLTGGKGPKGEGKHIIRCCWMNQIANHVGFKE